MTRKLSLPKPLNRCFLLLAAVAWIAGAAPREAIEDDDLKKMQGDWMVVSMTANGMDYPDDETQALFRTVDGNSYQVSRYSKAMVKGMFKIDSAANPKTIDSSTAADPSKPLLGIYEFEGLNWRICNAAPGKPRPTKFEAKTGSGHTLTVWQPEK